jgi:hypothetical protein
VSIARRRTTVPALLAALLAHPAAGLADGARVAGTVDVSGPRPAALPTIPAGIDAAVCGDTVPDESLVVDEGGAVRDVVVVLRGLPPGRGVPSTEVTIDNAGCRFVPRVQVAVRGQTVRVRNSDPVLHNARPVLLADPEVSIANLALAMRGQTMDLTRRLAEKLPAEGEAFVRLGCDVHPWMRGWLVVVDHPFAAVTDTHGRFAIADVPPGRYTVALWHERLGRSETPVSVPAGGTVSVDLTLPAAR